MPVRTRTLLAAAAACAALMIAAVQAHATIALPTGFDEVSLATGLTSPVDVTWAPDGRMFIASRTGIVYVHDPGAAANVNNTLLDISGHVNNGPSTDHGLLGIATDSDFASNHYLYLLYTYDNDSTDDNDPKVSTLTRVTVNDNDTVVGGTNSPTETTLLGSVHTVQTGTDGACGAPSNSVDCIPSEGSSHSIGTVRSAPDGTLFVGTGDGDNWQIIDPLTANDDNPATYRGKIMHVDRNGHGLSGHSFCPSDSTLTDVCTKIYAEGFRNPFRFTLLPSGGLAVGDVGQGNWEEIDLASGGEDFGWPCYEGAGPDQFSANGQSYQDWSQCQAKYANNQTKAPALAVAHHYPDCNASTPTGDTIVGGPVYEGDQYPAGYRGQLFFGDVGGGFFDATCGWIGRANISGNSLTGYQPFATVVSQGVDIETDPVNGNLVYVSLLDGAVREIEYGPGNHAPTATPTATPASGMAPLNVSFDAGAADQDGDTLSYDWNFGDGSTHSTAAAPDHEYSSPGDYTASVTVDDGRGKSTTKTVEVTATPDHAPDVSPSATPTSGMAPLSVSFDAGASDQDGDTLTYDWDFGDGSAHSTATAPSHEYSTPGDYTASVTVSDGRGKSTTKTVEVTATPDHAPDVSPSATPSSGTAPLSVSFDAGASDQDGDTLTYDWDFGDGSAHSSDPAPSHVYSKPGDYVASVTVDDGRGMSTTKLMPVHASTAVSPIAPPQPGPPLPPVPPAPKPRANPAALALSGTTARLSRHGTLQGSFRSAESVKTIRISLSRGCAWWSSRAHRLRRGKCSAAHWMKARLHRRGSRYSWAVKLGAKPKPGRYTVLLQAFPRSSAVTASGRLRLVLRVRR
ncbi:MAG TPA: PKD domain-containing protein [Thermoleophilaceae bacterium]|nr:PKD domain-containing protein [Thermoleophilaceae bacterium]